MARERPATRLVALALALIGAIAIGATAGTRVSNVTGSNMGLSITPTPLDFGPVQVGATAMSMLSLVNTDTSTSVTISAPLGKPNTTDCNAFSVTPSPQLSDTVPPMTSRSWMVSFKPTLASSYDCQWQLTTNDGNIDIIHLTGSGAVGHITVTPSPVAFNTQPLNSTVDQTVTISNDGSGVIAVTAITQTSGNPPFTILNLPAVFPVPLAPTQSTTFTARFHPTTMGSFVGNVNVADNAPASTGTNVMLTGVGSGGGGGAIITLAPSPVDFGTVNVGASGGSNVAVGDAGTSPLSVTMMTITGTNPGDFSFNAPGLGCSGGQTCNGTFQVTMTTPPYQVGLTCTPSAPGLRFATLNVTSNATGGTSTDTLQCNGAAPQVSVSPPSISYGVVHVNNTAHANLTVSNTGGADLHLTAFTFDGANPSDFATSACVAGCTIPPGKNVVADVTFTPPVRGVRGANLHVHSDDPTNSDVAVALDGTGGLPVMAITQPSSRMINFGGIPVGMTSSAVTVTVQNQGELALNINTATLSPAEYAKTGPATPIQLSPIATAQWSITCTPDSATTFPGMFTLTGDDPMTPSDSVQLSCMGINSNITATPNPLAFGDVRTDRMSTKTVTFKNVGALAVTINSAPVTGAGFTPAVQGSLPRTLNQNDTLLVDVTFAPPADMAYSGTLELHDNTGATAASVALSGDGRMPVYTVAPTTVDFGSRCVAQADSQDVMLTNTGDAHIQLTSTAISGGNGVFVIANGNVITPLDLAPTASHTVTVVGTAAQGSAAGSLVLTTDVNAMMTTNVSLSMMGTQSGVVANPASVDFGALTIGVASSPTTVTIINCSSKTLTVMGFAVSGTDGAAFQATGPSSASIPIGGNETWNVVFTAQHAGMHTAQLELHNDGATDPLVVPLTGNGNPMMTGGDGGVDGGSVPKSTSYYACACRSSSPAGGAPILLALALVLRRRRR
jgi:hypothetical protein